MIRQRNLGLYHTKQRTWKSPKINHNIRTPKYKRNKRYRDNDEKVHLMFGFFVGIVLFIIGIIITIYIFEFKGQKKFHLHEERLLDHFEKNGNIGYAIPNPNRHSKKH